MFGGLVIPSSSIPCPRLPAGKKLLFEHAREDCLLATGCLRDPASGRTDIGDLEDWPVVERDGFDFRDVPTVLNAFHYRALVLMAKIAPPSGKMTTR